MQQRQSFWILNNEGASSLMRGHYATAAVSFRDALQELSTEPEIANDTRMPANDTNETRRSADWHICLHLVDTSLCPFEITTDQGDILFSHVYTFDAIPTHLSTNEKFLAVSTVMFNLALCYHMRSFARREMHSKDLLRSRRLYEAAMKASIPLLDACNHDLPVVVSLLLDGLGNNLGCIGAEVYDYGLIDDMIKWHDLVGIHTPTMMLNHMAWSTSRRSPAPAA